jgi:hypothetical protein
MLRDLLEADKGGLQGLATTDSATKRLKAKDRSFFECMVVNE